MGNVGQMHFPSFYHCVVMRNSLQGTLVFSQLMGLKPANVHTIPFQSILGLQAGSICISFIYIYFFTHTTIYIYIHILCNVNSGLMTRPQGQMDLVRSFLVSPLNKRPLNHKLLDMAWNL